MRKSREEFFRWFLNLGFLGCIKTLKLKAQESPILSLSLSKNIQAMMELK
jgi:hypothetical protein